MKSGNLKTTVVSLLVLSTGGLVGCSLTATRPNQEMSNAEVALKAAKDLNADSLVPEIYRSAVDNNFKAKRDYRLKDFDNARKHALRATRLAEQAEFEAYRLGGATPESSGKAAPEGSTSDTDNAFKDTPTSPPAKAGGKPDGPTGPETPMGPPAPEPPNQKLATTAPDASNPNGAGALPAAGAQEPPPVIKPYGRVDTYDMGGYDNGQLRTVTSTPFSDFPGKDSEMQTVGSEGISMQVGLEDHSKRPLDTLDPKPLNSFVAGETEPPKFEKKEVNAKEDKKE